MSTQQDQIVCSIEQATLVGRGENLKWGLIPFVQTSINVTKGQVKAVLRKFDDIRWVYISSGSQNGVYLIPHPIGADPIPSPPRLLEASGAQSVHTDGYAVACIKTALRDLTESPIARPPSRTSLLLYAHRFRLSAGVREIMLREGFTRSQLTTGHLQYVLDLWRGEFWNEYRDGNATRYALVGSAADSLMSERVEKSKSFLNKSKSRIKSR